MTTRILCAFLLLAISAAGCGSGELPATTETPKVEPEVIDKGIQKSYDLGNAKYRRGGRGR